MICGSKNTVIPNDVTSIGDYAFSGCSDLTSVTIPNSVISINEAAFSDCSSLTSVTIPNSVTYIGHGAFQDCGTLTSVTIPNSVTYIGNNAFSECFAMTSVTIPSSVTYIGNGAFYNYNLTSVTVEKGTPINIKKEYTFSNRANATLYVPAGCKAAYEAADYWKEFKEIIESEYPPTGTEVINGIYYNLKSDYTAEVTENPNKYSGSVSIPATVTYGNIEYNVNAIGYNAFSECSGLTSVTIPNSVISIGNSAFSWSQDLTSIIIPSSVTSIIDTAFDGCSSMTSLSVEPGNTKYDSRNNCNAIIETETNKLISGTKNTVIPNNVTSIGNRAFYGCRGLTSITIPNSVTVIGDRAFMYSGLTSITIPNNVTSIEEGAFGGCSSMTSMEVMSGNQKYDSRDNCYAIIETSTNTIVAGCSATTIPATVKEIGSYALWSLENCTIHLPSTITKINDNAFGWSNQLTLEVEHTTPLTINENVFEGIENSILRVPVGCKDAYTTATGWEKFNEIQEWASPSDMFVFAANPDGITCSVTGFTDYCVGDVAIPESWEGLSVTSIGDHAFRNCSGLTSITIPTSVTSIGSRVFAGCSGLSSLNVEVGNTEYDSRENCNAIIKTATNTLILGTKNTTIPASVTSIGNDAFFNCSGLTSITIPNSVTSIGSQAFYKCSGLTSITIPNSVTSIGIEVFSGCSGLTSVTIPNSVTSIGNEAFYKCSGLTSITIPNSVTSIGNEAFDYCSGLSSIIIPNSVTFIGNNAFGGCSGLTSITIPNSVTSIGDKVFKKCSGLTSITIPNSVTSIGDEAFNGCSDLTSVIVEVEAPITISEDVFSNRANATLYVPAGSKAAYEAADYWNEFKEIIEIGMDLSADEIFSGTNLWAGYVAQEDLIPGTGLKVYVITKLGTTTATASQIDYMPQGVPVLLRVFNADRNVSNREGFILFNDEFVLVNEGVLPAGRVFLPANNLQLSRGMTRSIVIDDDDATGIEGNWSAADDADEQWFDLQGRRLEQKPTKKGIYILNGRKVVVK